MKTITLPLKNSKHRSPCRIPLLLVPLAIACFGLSPKAQGQLSPPPDGCYPNYTTAEGCNALQFLGTGAGNTGIGWEEGEEGGQSSLLTQLDDSA